MIPQGPLELSINRHARGQWRGLRLTGIKRGPMGRKGRQAVDDDLPVIVSGLVSNVRRGREPRDERHTALQISSIRVDFVACVCFVHELEGEK